MLLDEGLIAREGERWKPARDLADVVLPPSIEAVLAARLDRLGAGGAGRGSARGGDRPHLQLGRSACDFTRGRSRRQSPAHSRPSFAKEVVFRDAQALSGAEAYRFGHILVRDAAYKGLPKEKRAELHERAATFSRSPRATAPPSTRSSSVTTSSRPSASGPSSGR